jgi:hypothetical protein
MHATSSFPLLPVCPACHQAGQTGSSIRSSIVWSKGGLALCMVYAKVIPKVQQKLGHGIRYDY